MYVAAAGGCVPLWLVVFTLAQSIALVYIMMAGIACNEMINEDIDAMLANWQHKFKWVYPGYWQFHRLSLLPSFLSIILCLLQRSLPFLPSFASFPV